VHWPTNTLDEGDPGDFNEWTFTQNGTPIAVTALGAADSHTTILYIDDVLTAGTTIEVTLGGTAGANFTALPGAVAPQSKSATVA
jgi:hypothetical protein